MDGRQHFTAVIGILEAYFDGLYRADSQTLAKVFHQDARYINAVQDDYMNYSVAEYFAIVDRRTSPASSGEARADRIISIEMGGARMAFAKVSMTMLGRDYLDFLTLVLDVNGWRIISKVFSYSQQAQGK